MGLRPLCGSFTLREGVCFPECYLNAGNSSRTSIMAHGFHITQIIWCINLSCMSTKYLSVSDLEWIETRQSLIYHIYLEMRLKALPGNWEKMPCQQSCLYSASVFIVKTTKLCKCALEPTRLLTNNLDNWPLLKLLFTLFHRGKSSHTLL